MASPSPTSFPTLKFYNLTDCPLFQNLRPKIALRGGLFLIHLCVPPGGHSVHIRSLHKKWIPNEVLLLLK